MIWGLCRCIFHQAPLALQPGNMLQYFAGLKDQTKQIAFDSASAGKWWLVPRDGGEPRLIDTEPGMIWHYGNAFEDASGAAKGLALYKQPSCASVALNTDTPPIQASLLARMSCRSLEKIRPLLL